MKQVAVALVCAAGAALIVVGSPAHGQNPPQPPPPPPGAASATPTTGPTATPTAVVPPGAQIVSAMQAAVNPRGSLHTSSKEVVDVLGVHLEFTFHADVSWRAAIIHGVGTARTGSGTTAKTTRSEFIDHKAAYASRSGARGKWNCHVGTKTYKQDRALLAGFLRIKAAEATNAGAETVDGVAVWHIRAPLPALLSNPPATTPVDIYVDQATNLPVRYVWNESVTSQGETVSLLVTSDYGQFGKRVRAKLPHACTAKKLALRAGSPAVLATQVLVPGR